MPTTKKQNMPASKKPLETQRPTPDAKPATREPGGLRHVRTQEFSRDEKAIVLRLIRVLREPDYWLGAFIESLLMKNGELPTTEWINVGCRGKIHGANKRPVELARDAEKRLEQEFSPNVSLL
jgi:hypothetical protein